MSQQVFVRSLPLPHPSADVFGWLERPGALERLTPPWEKVTVRQPAESLQDGTRVILAAKVGPWTTEWEVEHRDYRPGVQFRDVALRGPFAQWSHLHRVEADSPGESRLIDHIEYTLPFGVLGRLGAGFVRGKLEQMFRYRHTILQEDLALARRYGAVRKLRILVAGASGFVGRALVPFLRSQGHEVVRLVRRPAVRPDELTWAPGVAALDPHVLRTVDAVINLAGEGIAEARWSAARKAALRASRLATTRTLVQAMEKAKHRPFVFVNASAIGFYGSRGDERLDEDSGPGRGFLAELCGEWEAAALAAEEWGVRTAVLRTGVVLSPDGGALARQLPLFRLGLGGPLGNGQGWLSWISRDDLLGAIYHSLMDQRCRGALNAVAPQPVRQRDWARTLGETLGRPAWVPAPSWALRLALGELADEALLASTRVVPAGLQRAGYVFRHPQLGGALAALLGTEPAAAPESEREARTPRRGRGRRR